MSLKFQVTHRHLSWWADVFSHGCDLSTPYATPIFHKWVTPISGMSHTLYKWEELRFTHYHFMLYL